VREMLLRYLPMPFIYQEIYQYHSTKKASQKYTIKPEIDAPQSNKETKYTDVA